MFNCQICLKPSRNYHSLVKKGRIVKYHNENVNKTGKVTITGGKGWEIVREIAVCQGCYGAEKDKPVVMEKEEQTRYFRGK